MNTLKNGGNQCTVCTSQAILRLQEVDYGIIIHRYITSHM